MTHQGKLREIISSILVEGSWRIIQERFAVLELDWRDDLSPGWGKGKYVEHVLKDLPDAKLIELANKCTTNLPAEGKTRHIDDILERITTNDRQAISRVTRISLATAFEGRVLTPNVDFDGFIGSIGFERDSGIYTSFRYDPNGQLVSSDFFSSIKVPATHREALEAFGFLDWSDRRVISFLESLIHPEIRRGSEQTELAALIDTHLRPDGLTPRVTGIISGHPVFSIQRLHSSRHDRPKNIIFASSTKGFKPIIGLADALDNELIVLENEDTCLVYDDPTPNEGLTWVRLADWWAKKQKISNTEEARRSKKKPWRPSTRSTLISTGASLFLHLLPNNKANTGGKTARSNSPSLCALRPQDSGREEAEA